MKRLGISLMASLLMMSTAHAKGKMSTGSPVIMGALDKSLIDKVIQRNSAKFLYCYQRELTKHPGLKGKVTLNFTIAKTGSVTKSSTHKTSLANANVEACLNQQMKTLTFPEPQNGGIVIVKYPLVFS